MPNAGRFVTASRQFASVTPKFFSIFSERSQPGVTPTAVRGLFSSSAVRPLTNPLDIGLDEVVVEADVPPEVGIGLRGAVGHLHDEPPAFLSLGGAQHKGDRGMAVIRCVCTPICNIRSPPAQSCSRAERLVGIEREQGRLDLLVNDIFGGDRYMEWDKPL
jgi:hypothetical protein